MISQCQSSAASEGSDQGRAKRGTRNSGVIYGDGQVDQRVEQGKRRNAETPHLFVCDFDVPCNHSCQTSRILSSVLIADTRVKIGLDIPQSALGLPQHQSHNNNQHEERPQLAISTTQRPQCIA
jgi:hypothetical protein